MERYPINGLFAYSAPIGTNVSCIDVLIRENMANNTNKTIAKILQEVVLMGLPILDMKYSLSEDGEAGIMFLVLASGEDQAKMLIERINGFSSNIKASLGRKYKRTCYSNIAFPVKFSGSRWIYMGPANLDGILFDLKKILGKQVESYILRQLGRYIGKNIYEYYTESLGHIDSLEETIRFLSMLFQISSWGIIEEYEISENRIMLIIRDLWEVVVLKEKQSSDKPKLTLGVIEGFYSSLTKRDIRSEVALVKKEEGVYKTEIQVYF